MVFAFSGYGKALAFMGGVRFADFGALTATDIEILLLNASSTVPAEIATAELLTDFTTLGETTAWPYERKVYGNSYKAVTYASGSAFIDANDPVWTELGGSVDDTITGVLFIQPGTVDDTDAVPLFYASITPFSTNGSGFTAVFDTEGVFEAVG